MYGADQHVYYAIEKEKRKQKTSNVPNAAGIREKENNGEKSDDNFHDNVRSLAQELHAPSDIKTLVV